MLYMYPPELMNAYPISPDIKNPKNNGIELIQPMGERIYPEFDVKASKTVEMQGFGSGKRRNKDDDEKPNKKDWGANSLNN